MPDFLVPEQDMVNLGNHVILRCDGADFVAISEVVFDAADLTARRRGMYGEEVA